MYRAVLWTLQGDFSLFSWVSWGLELGMGRLYASPLLALEATQTKNWIHKENELEGDHKLPQQPPRHPGTQAPRAQTSRPVFCPSLDMTTTGDQIPCLMFGPEQSTRLAIQEEGWGGLRWQWHPTPVLLPGKSHGRRSLEGCSPWGRWGSDTTERLHFHFTQPLKRIHLNQF